MMPKLNFKKEEKKQRDDRTLSGRAAYMVAWRDRHIEKMEAYCKGLEGKCALLEALLACLVIGIVTFFICYAGLGIGKKAGTKLAGKAGILGGAILIFIGSEIFITGFI